MQSDFPILSPHDTLWIALQEMSLNQLAALPVVQDEMFCGLVTIEDIKNAWRLPARSRRLAESPPETGD
jgi:CBS domain-containing protein